MTWLLLLAATLALWRTADVVAGAHPVGPNRFLGSCLDAAWVEAMEASMNVSSQERDSSGRLVRPFMQTALKYPRYQVEDPRTAAGTAYTDTCMTKGQIFYGADQPSDGSTRGEVNGTLVIDMGDWDSHALSSMTAAIIAEEVVGYKVSLNYGGPTAEITMRMSSARTGVCTPTHLNTKAWTSSSMSKLRVYFNESYLVGGVGYFGLTGLYTTRDFVLEGADATPPYFPCFWMHYKMSDVLIGKLDVAAFKSNPEYYPPAETFCPNGTMGCLNHCERSEACTNRELAGESCLVIAMMKPGYDRGYFQSVVSNIGIPAYFCFIGYDGVNKYASDAAASKTPVVFIHWEPDMFHVTHEGLFDRIFLPRTNPARVKLSTGDYGENGYGKKTNNPLDVDFPSMQLTKFAAPIVKDLPIGSMFSKFTLSDTDINDLLSKYNVAMNDKTEPAPYFRAACNWVKANYEVWSEWVDRLPLCKFEEHIESHVSGCESGSSVREIHFAWKSPNPGNASLPYNCDGGVDALPETIETSRSCDWIFDNHRIWSGWVDAQPACDSTFYDYNVSECDSNAHRTVAYFWLLPNVSNREISAECSGGDTLPEDVLIDCEYMPTSSTTFAAILLVLGLYLSFLIRNVSVEFQESPWIFGSVVVVLVGCLVIMPMTYLVTMRASTFYVFLALALIICTILIMCLMLVPKLFRLKEAAMSSTSGVSSTNSIKSRTSLAPVPTTNLTNLADTDKEIPRDASRIASQKYQVRPLANANNNFSTMNDEVTSTTNGA